MITTNKKIIADSIEHYGKPVQSTVCMEECSELIQAISKCLRYGDTEENLDNLVEEIADVFICISMLKQMYDIPDVEIMAYIKYKQNRIEERMKQ